MSAGPTHIMLGADMVVAPSPATLGPNTYLNQRDFWVMLTVALLLHALIIGGWELLPKDEVTNIPVRALTFRIADEDRISMTPTPMMAPATIAQTITPTPDTPAIASSPQQYVREVGAAIPEAASLADASPAAGAAEAQESAIQAAQVVKARYTQEISNRILKHKLYPADANGAEGRVVVRIQIDRAGNVRYYAIDQSAGLKPLDDAALDMIRRANPVPAVPEDYPAGTLVEFLIPISFTAPQ